MPADSAPDYVLVQAADGEGTRELAAEIDHYLQFKGYCVLNAGFGSELDEALDDVAALRDDGLLVPPQEEILSGLLGPEGSSQMVVLPPAGADDRAGYEKLQVLDRGVSYVARCVGPFCQRLGLHDLAQSRTFLLRGGATDDENDVPGLTEDACSLWMGTFCESKLMLVYFLGPGEGVLELEPFADVEASAVEIVTGPDVMVILRCDTLSHAHYSSEGDYALCSWIAGPAMTGPRGWRSYSPEVRGMMPAAKDLFAWVERRLPILQAQDLELRSRAVAAEPNEMLPREWQRLMRHSYFSEHSNKPVALRGEAGHVPGCYDNEVLWKSLAFGIDYVSPVPFERWDHQVYYDPDPQGYLRSENFKNGRIVTNINHGQFIDGVTLFDNKFFGISVMETVGMDPMQRHILETTYAALFQAGYRKKDLMNAYIAAFVGTTNAEFNYIDRPVGACSGTGSAQAITSNRLSFQLGMMGPSTSIDCEMSSAAMGLLLGATAVSPNNAWRTNTGGDSSAAVVGGVYLCMSPFMWPRFNAWMDPVGRCRSFDANANGYVRGECCTSACLKPYAETVDGQLVVADAPCLGTLVGWHTSANGRGANMMAPSGPMEQECILNALRHSGIEALDLDSLECHGIGLLLADSVEASAVAASLRGAPGSEAEPLVLGSVKSSVSAQCECCGITAFLKVVYNILYASNVPSMHLKQVNPHMELQDHAVIFNDESVAARDRYGFHGVSSRGMGGTNVNLVAWFHADERRVRLESTVFEHRPFEFWPGGGGSLVGDQVPSKGYSIVGSWNQWEPEEMHKVDNDTFAFTVTLGANRFETFQVWLDGDSARVLHPISPRGRAGSAARGPAAFSEVLDLAWVIDGRDLALPGPESLPVAGAAAEGALLSLALAGHDHVARGVPTRDSGRPGDQYEVQLLVAGKYRAVTWKRAPGRGAPDGPSVVGTYYVSGSWNDWRFEPMAPSKESPSTIFTAEVGPLPSGSKFHIVRNRDFQQAFHPPYPDSTDQHGGEVCGPDDQATGLSWCLGGAAGSRFRIELVRPLDEDLGDAAAVSWHPIQGQ